MTPIGVLCHRCEIVTLCVSSISGVAITVNKIGTAATLTITEMSMNSVKPEGEATLSKNCPAQIPPRKIII